MKLLITKGVAIGHRREKEIPIMEGVMRTTKQMEMKNASLDEELRISH